MAKLTETSSEQLETQAGKAHPDWQAVAQAGKALADGLRSEELRTATGEAGLLAAVGKLLDIAARADEREERLMAGRTELGRVVGNACYEHDPNRQLSLDAGIPAALAAVLAKVLGMVEEGEKVEQQRVLGVEELKLVRATVGALLNMSLKFDPVRRELTKVSLLTPLLAIVDARTSAGKTTAPVYTAGCWAAEPVGDVEEWQERLQIASTIISWTVNVLEDVLNESKAEVPPSGIFALSSALLAVCEPASPPAASPHFTGEDASDFLDTDIELLSVSAALLEGTSIDLDSAKTTLAFSAYSASLPYPSSSLLSHLLTFIHSASPPPFWSTASDDPARTAKAFSTIKAAVVRAVVEAPNSDEVMERLWRETKTPVEEGEGEKSWLVEKMVLWLEEAQGEGREDMLICAAHLLAGLGRKDEHTLSLVHDYGLAAPLARIVKERVEQQLAAQPEERGRPGETTQILFGVVSLLRHLAIPVMNRQVVGELGVIPSVALLLRKELDIVGPLQLSSIGLLKHLSANNIPNSLQVLGIPPPASSSSSTAVDSLPLSHVLSLTSRTDDTRLRSEATRILVNVVRSLWSSRPGVQPEEVDEEELLRRQGREVLLQHGQEVVKALSELIRLSEKYPMLINEGIVALALLAGSGERGASLVLAALTRPSSSPLAPSEPPSSDPSSSPLAAPELKRSTSLAVSPSGDPPCSALMLASWLALLPPLPSASANPTGVRPEMTANAFALVVAVLQGAAGEEIREDGTKLKELLVGPISGAREKLDKEAGQDALKGLVRRAWELVSRA
ncbi:hypothetical protein JCM10213v2_004892 [Rhodosporidiobolus nylandii]